VFQHQTVAALAKVAAVSLVATVAEVTVGALEPTPIIHWLLERTGPIKRFNQQRLLQVPAVLKEEDLGTALQALLDHHDALRLRLLEGAGLEIAPVGAVQVADCLRRVDVSALEPASLVRCMAEHRQAAEGRLDPATGAMVQVVWFDAGAQRSGRLLVVLHHLVVDGVSWRILLPDLEAAWRAVQQGGRPQLQPVGTSFRGWSQRLHREAASRSQELTFWTDILSTPDPLLSLRPLDRQRDLSAAAGSLRLRLPTTLTAALLTSVPALYHARINDVLLTAFAIAVANWRKRQGKGGATAVLLELEGHGREEIFPGVDLSRTVGWFTSLFPVRLDAGTIEWTDTREGTAGIGQALKQVKEQLRRLPDHGLGYGLLRYLNADTQKELSRLAAPQIGFNYLGRFGASAAQDWGSAPEAGKIGSGGDPGLALAHALEVNAVTMDYTDGPQLTADWSWAGKLFSAQQVEDLAHSWFQALEGLVKHAARPGAGGFTPSDLPLVALTQAQIERLEQKHLRRAKRLSPRLSEKT
jgi:non-ribosomal peptide synthase protein (TIGR01720 family)